MLVNVAGFPRMFGVMGQGYGLLGDDAVADPIEADAERQQHDQTAAVARRGQKFSIR